MSTTKKTGRKKTASKKPAPIEPQEGEQDTPQPQTMSAQEEAQQRAAACSRDIAQLLVHYRCKLVVRTETEFVGGEGKLLVTPAPGIEPIT